MKLLIIGPLGAGKSSLAYAVSKKFNLPRLNLDEVCRNPDDGNYYSEEEQFSKLKIFLNQNPNWVIEGSQKYLYATTAPEVVVDMRINRLSAAWRIMIRFRKAKKLIGKNIDKDLPVQAYHYRKITFSKIKEYDAAVRQINIEIAEFLRQITIPIVKCKSFRDHDKIFAFVAERINKNEEKEKAE